jgi:NAD(P)-dependent dehydrogenase (short-subunit alcohol dehydrogenase family)
MNIVATKFGAELAGEGIKTLSLSPGWVATDAGQSLREVNRVGTDD